MTEPVVTSHKLPLTETLGLLLDKAAIGLSALCAIHCLLLPVALVVLPSLAVLPFDDEHFHQLLVVVVLPTSLFALGMGCRRHHQWRIFAWGGAGLLVLTLAALLGHEILGEHLEKVVTLTGTSLVAAGHFMNYRRCRAVNCQHEH